jgi:beta-ureidopropionase / N-carbamoyl-L-amino-acid hydrolase
MSLDELRVDLPRLMGRLETLGQVGTIPGGGVCRLALTQDDKAGRDLVVSWMRKLGLTISVDPIGNVVALRQGTAQLPPVLMGSHIDTVRTGGRYDGNLGVLAGLEVLERLTEAQVETKHPVGVAFFTNEEGSRFAPDMMGSAVHQGALPLEQALETVGIEGSTVEENLRRIGYAGQAPLGMRAAASLELHVEQGPVLERTSVTIGAVEGVQGISWTELTIGGTANHAGTTPMSMRHDAGYAAAEITCFVRTLAQRLGGDQVATVGALTLSPNLVNVIAERAVMTVDLRNTDEAILQQAEKAFFAFLEELSAREGTPISHRTLARFAPVRFDPTVVEMVEAEAKALGHSVRRMPSGAGHDAQMFAPNCPAGMIFVPSVGGISHNPKEHTAPEDIGAGANVLLRCVLRAAG